MALERGRPGQGPRTSSGVSPRALERWKCPVNCLSQSWSAFLIGKKREISMPFPRASQALSRFTVLDLTRVRAGPTCVRQLADWGANVIKVDALLEDAGGEQPGGPRHGSDFQN